MSKKQYPPQTGYFAVKVKSNQSTDTWKDFAKARFQISVGQEYHEGEKLKAVANWSKERFENVYFCANDTLQRFNLMFEQSIEEDEAYALSNEMGQSWVNRNMPIIEGVPQAQVIRWDKWKNKEQYPKGLLKTEWLYQNNKEFKLSIDRNIAEIWSRRKKMKPELYSSDKFDRFFALSKKYLIEEMATFSLMYASEKAIDIYPGTTLYAATLFQGKKVENAPEGLGQGHFCRIDFARNKNFDPLT